MELKKPQKPRLYTAEGIKVMGVAFELGFIIALPILAFATFGKWLDNRYHQGYFIYLGIVLAIASTSIWLYRRFSEMIRKLEEASKKNQKQTPNDMTKEQKEKTE